MSELHNYAKILEINSDFCLQLLDGALKNGVPPYGPDSHPDSHQQFLAFANSYQNFLDACKEEQVPATIILRQSLLDPRQLETILSFSQKVINDLSQI